MSRLIKLASTYRTHFLKDLPKITSLPQQVTITGYVSRSTKLFFNVKCPESGDAHELQIHTPENLHKQNLLSIDSAISISGTLQERPIQNKRSGQKLGNIELKCNDNDVKMFNQCVPALHRNKLGSEDWKNSGIEYQYKNRFLGLRDGKLQSVLKERSKIIQRMRTFLHEEYDFTEIETPTLFSPTPGGAREFIVPSSYYSKKFYSLVQSPQQFKQLLMIGGVNRYFQVARCYRDEKLRDDRQPEFTQLDMEMSYVSREEIMGLIENLLKFALPGRDIPEKFESMSYETAMRFYGCDKPDTRYGMKIGEIEFEGEKKFEIDFSEYEIGVKKAKKLISSLKKHKEFEEKWANSGCRISSGKISAKSVEILGEIRTALAKEFLNLDSTKLNFLWVTDFPLFEAKENDIHRGDTQSQSELQTVHHPFTKPLSGKLETDFESLKNCNSAAYDLVLNGQEVGGGSIRIHDPEMQKKVFKILDINKNGELDHILRALSGGAPPHGGIALGLDRLLAIILDVESIQDVMAFPKSAGGKCYMSNAPVEIDQETRDVYHL